jgi:mRNA interferase MazF
VVTPAAGDVVLVSFPFTDLSTTRLRPAVVLAGAGRGDWILCQVTSNPYADPQAVEITSGDFRNGSLHAVSYARPGKLFTASETLIRSRVGDLTAEAFRRVLDAVITLLDPSQTP